MWSKFKLRPYVNYGYQCPEFQETYKFHILWTVHRGIVDNKDQKDEHLDA